MSDSDWLTLGLQIISPLGGGSLMIKRVRSCALFYVNYMQGLYVYNIIQYLARVGGCVVTIF